MSEGLASHILAGRRVAAIRGDALRHDTSLEGAVESPLATVVPLHGVSADDVDVSPLPSARLSAPACVLRVDAQTRICLGALCPSLGWQAGTPVVLAPADDGRVVARRGLPGEVLDAAEHLAALDSDRRLVLPTAARACLGVTASSQVAAVVAGDRLVLADAAIAWAAVAGSFVPVVTEAAVANTKSGPRRRAVARSVPV